jgi:2-dehydro-3-deoxyphosphogluconate aldolase/(4S)-4-hydroxy-2-oxoglutarate aldolase
MSVWLDSRPIIPVVVSDAPEIAADLADALDAGGVTCAEITLRTPRALELLAAMAARAPAGFAVGAGTVLDVSQVDAVADAGASFVVSPGYDPEIVDRVRALGMDVLPGVASATEVQRARRDGVETLKFFPADRLGGWETIAALAAVFDGVGFVPSGGAGADNLGRYLSMPAVPAVSGSWLAPRPELDAGDLSAVAERSRSAIRIAAEARPSGRSE